MQKKMLEEEAAAKAEAAGLDPAKAVEILQQEAALAAANASANAASASNANGGASATGGDTADVKMEDGTAAPQTEDKTDGKPAIFAALPDETTLQHMLMNHVMSNNALPVGVDLAAEPGFEGPEFDPPMKRAVKEARERLLANFQAMQEIFGSNGSPASQSIKALLERLRKPDDDTEFLEEMRRKLRKLESESESNVSTYKTLHSETQARSEQFEGAMKAIHRAASPAELKKVRDEVQHIFHINSVTKEEESGLGDSKAELRRVARPKDGRASVSAASYIHL